MRHRRLAPLLLLPALLAAAPAGVLKAEYGKRLAAVKADDVQGMADLARALYGKAVAADPENAAGRRGLRQCRFEGGWRDDDALLADYVSADAEGRRQAVAEALKAGSSEYTPKRLEQHRRWAAAPKGDLSGLALEGKGWKSAYVLEVPPGYTGLKAVPLVVFLHGGVQGGVVEPESVCGYAMPMLERGWIAAFPKCPSQPAKSVEGWATPESEACVLDLVARLQEGYAVDPRRIYLAGISMGALGALRLAGRHPDRFAAAAAMSAPAWGLDLKGLKRINLFLIHGSEDRSCSPQAVRDLDAELTALGSEHRYVELAGAGHDLTPDAIHQVCAWIAGFALPTAP